MTNLFDNSPKKAGYSFPAEWAKHEATWLTWPHKEASWHGRVNWIRYMHLIVNLSKL
ncbi:agmatine deiminase family protein [Pedobacter sp. NJ-S-72]